ncbi:MAG: 4Fe-4S binding protein [Acidobacteria bacterium]|nr:4Fe-4S binding protein [Acidobacteriota bacterium]
MNKQARSIIRIDESKCDGCGLCADACAEGAIRIVDGVAKLVSETYCDGLGACLGECPQGAITIEQREADAYDEDATREHLAKMGREHKPHAHDGAAAVEAPAAGPAAHVHAHAPGGDHGHVHAQGSPQAGPGGMHAAHAGGCPGSRMRVMAPRAAAKEDPSGRVSSRLAQWPVQLALVPPAAPYFQGADLLIAADCVPFAYAEFHRDFLEGKSLVVGCPKLDDLEFYRTKLTQIFQHSDVRSVTVLRLEVPCCGGIVQAAVEAARASGKAVPVKAVTIGIGGEILETRTFETAAAPREGAPRAHA